MGSPRLRPRPAAPVLRDIQAVGAAGRRIRLARVSGDRVLRSVRRILGETVLCSMATVSGGGRAHINTAYFAFSEAFELVFLSHPGSLHCRNLARRSSMAMTVFSTRQSWTDPGRGVQLFGRCRPATNSEVRIAERLYGARFPSFAAWTAGLDPGAAGRDYRLYTFVVSSLKVHDEREFGDGVFVRATVGR